MKKYIFEEYRDSKGTGSEIMFDTAVEAVEYAKKDWEHFCEHDKQTYRNDMMGTHRVYEIEITAEQVELYNDGDLDVTLNELETAAIWDFKEVADDEK